MSKTELPNFTIKQLLEAGVHFGHKTMRRNPKMSKYIHTSRNGISIIDLNKTAVHLHNAMKTVKEIAKNNGRILFVATKKQAIEPIAEAAKRSGQYYVNFRWLGGMLTNWKTVSQSIKTLKKIEERLAAPEEIGYNKKEKLVFERQRAKLEQALGGIKNMGGYPDLVFVIDTYKESLAIAEAKKLGVPIMAILDSNCNPDGITYPIPGNDDSAKSIKLYCRLLSDAAIAGTKENMAINGVDISKFEGDELPANIHELKGGSKEDKKPAARKEHEKKDSKPHAKAEHKSDHKSDHKVEHKKKEIVKKSEEKSEKSEKAEEKKAKPAAKKAAAKPAAKKAAAKK